MIGHLVYIYQFSIIEKFIVKFYYKSDLCIKENKLQYTKRHKVAIHTIILKILLPTLFA